MVRALCVLEPALSLLVAFYHCCRETNGPCCPQRLLKDYPLVRDEAATVDVYLPVCNEPLDLIENTWQYITALQYPAGRISVFVLGDGADDGVRSLAKRFDFNHIRRPNRPDLKKAGNLRYAFSQTSGEFYTVFDADFCPRPEFLLETMPYILADKRRAILQTPQFFRSSDDQAWTEQGAGAMMELVYRVMQTSRDAWGAAICVGSNALYRRAALEPIGGTVPIDYSEDTYTGLYAVTHGWSLKYLALNLACGICPDTPRAYFSQQMRWCHGSTSLITQRDFWKSKNSVNMKLCYMTGFLYYTTISV